MSTEEKIEAASKKKEEGNSKFKAGKYALASKRYEKVYDRNCLLIYEFYVEHHLTWFSIFSGCQIH